ncbi:MAG: sensor histidine kinase [Lachnospirales bacterium]
MKLKHVEKRFFIKKFIRYYLLLFIPTFFLFIISLNVINKQIAMEVKNRGDNTLSNINTNLNYVINNIAMQNNEFTNNSYMMVALKKLLTRDYIAYSDTIYLRNIKATLWSIENSYDYIDSIYIYLDGYDSYFSSENSIKPTTTFVAKNFIDSYKKNKDANNNWVEVLNVNGKRILRIYQKLMLAKGAIIMNIDTNEYSGLLNEILNNPNEAVYFLDKDMNLLFSWNNLLKNNVNNSFAEIDIEGYRKKYFVNSYYNENYNINLVSLIPKMGSKDTINFFIIILVINAIVMFFLAYYTTRQNFSRLNYLIQVFRDAEDGIYETKRITNIRSEYDLILNNIISLFLQTINLKSKILKEEHEREVAELIALQMQINPHFLFNTIQTIEFEVRNTDRNKKDVIKVLNNLSHILKYTFQNPTGTVLLKTEIEYLKKYIDIMNFRFDQNIIVYFEIQEEFENIKVFPLILQPLVENSILHGIRNINKQGYIKVKVKNKNGNIIFKVIDNGIGMSSEFIRILHMRIDNPENKHIGISNLYKRMKIYFGENSRLIIKSKKNFGSIFMFVVEDMDKKRD